MATSLKRVTVKATPGKNAPVHHVLRLEDMLQQMQQGAVKSARGRAVPAAVADDLTAVRRLAAELELRMRELRSAISGPATVLPATRSSGARKKAPSSDR